MFDPLFARAGVLWSAIIDFIQTDRGNIASGLASFTTSQIQHHPQLDVGQQRLLIHRFAIEGEVDGKSPLDLFLASQADLSLEDRRTIGNWRQSFVGLLTIVQIFPNGLEVMNWLTAKHYRVQFTDEPSQTAMSRLKVGDLIVAQLSQIVDIDWAILAPWVALGRLGRPKLAVAVGTFRQNYPHYLYSDAPDELAAAWESVVVYHDRFVEFFGSDEITLAGKQLQTRVGEFQTWMLERQLATAGIERDRSLAEIATDSGVTADEVQALTRTLGLTDSSAAQGQAALSGKMVAPTVELPLEMRSAAAVTALSHPHWGQMFLVDYPRLKNLLASGAAYLPADLKFVRKCLADPQMNAGVWRRLAIEFPERLPLAISMLEGFANGQSLELSNFTSTDLDSVLTKFNKYLEPDLPDLASVPIHLHELFQAAVLEVSKDKPKPKSQPKKGGFGAKS